MDPSTLVSNGVKVADKGKMWKIMKIAKNGLILLLDIKLDVLYSDMYIETLEKSPKSGFPFCP